MIEKDKYKKLLLFNKLALQLELYLQKVVVFLEILRVYTI